MMVQEKVIKSKLAPRWLELFTVVEVKADSPNVTILKRNKQTLLHRIY